MGRIFEVMRAVLAAMASVVWITVKEGGRLVRKALKTMAVPQASLPTEPAEPPALRTHVAPAAADLKPSLSYDCVTRIAQALTQGLPPPSADLAKLQPALEQWLMLLDDHELRVVASAAPGAIAGHIDGRQFLPGLLRCGRASMIERADHFEQRRHHADEILEARQTFGVSI